MGGPRGETSFSWTWSVVSTGHDENWKFLFKFWLIPDKRVSRLSVKRFFQSIYSALQWRVLHSTVILYDHYQRKLGKQWNLSFCFLPEAKVSAHIPFDFCNIVPTVFWCIINTCYFLYGVKFCFALMIRMMEWGSIKYMKEVYGSGKS